MAKKSKSMTQKQGVRLAIPAGDPALPALRGVTREWLVPCLVEKFLRQQGIELSARSNQSSQKAQISCADEEAESIAVSKKSPVIKKRNMHPLR